MLLLEIVALTWLLFSVALVVLSFIELELGSGRYITTML